MSDETYRIVRGYFNTKVPKEIIEEGLSLEEARDHCQDPETSSSTCTSKEGCARTEEFGPWFDRYEEE